MLCVYIYILYVHIFCICIVSFCLLNMGRLMANTTWATSPGLFWGYSIPTYFFSGDLFHCIFQYRSGTGAFFGSKPKHQTKPKRELCIFWKI